MDHNWIQTYTGRKFWPANPRVKDICIEDIAHALSLCNRFAGHTCEPYSVAQHSVLMSNYCEEPVWALLHDASEAYLHDITRPLKIDLPDYKAIEDRVQECIAKRFKLTLPIPECVHEWDRIMLAAEKRDLFDQNLPYEHTINIDTGSVNQIIPWSCGRAESEFLKRYRQLLLEAAVA